MGKGEIARYEQFPLFPQCFQKACFRGASKGVIVWEWVNPFPVNHNLIMTIYKKHLENIMGKGLTHYHTMLHFDTLKINSCGKQREKEK